MSDHAHNEHLDLLSQGGGAGFRAADVLGVLAVSTFLAAIGLITFFAATAFGG
jgi:hypothetical protein